MTPSAPSSVTLSIVLTAAQSAALEAARTANHKNPVVALPTYASASAFATALLVGAAQAQTSGMGATLTQLLVCGVKPPTPKSTPTKLPPLKQRRAALKLKR